VVVEGWEFACLRFLAAYLLGAGTLYSAETAPTNGPITLPPVTVIGIPNSLTSPSIGKAAIQKREVPGAFTLRDTQEMERGHASGFQDLLAGVPGLILQSENGTEVGEASVRGSGVLSDEEPIGIEFLQDGFPMKLPRNAANIAGLR
jgi:outer membrane receptor for Fe3+-dicitrate